MTISEGAGVDERRHSAKAIIMSGRDAISAGIRYGSVMGDPDDDLASCAALEDAPEDPVCPICEATEDRIAVIS